VYGAACAVVAEDLKRILAYSTISQLGIMFVGIGVGTSLGATYHLISQGLFKALAFLAAGSVLHATGLRNVEEMGGLRRTMKYTYIGFFLSVLAMSGLPPLIGFWSKDWIASTALTTNVAVSVLIILSTILTALYGFRATFKVFHGSSKLEKLPVESPSIMILPMVILSISVVLGWLVLDYQPLLPLFNVLKALDFLTVGASLTALVIGAGIAYLAFQSKIEATQRLVLQSPLIQKTRKSLLEGLGFDKLYGFLWTRIVLPLSNVASSLQTGLLGINAALMLLALLAVLFLLASRVF